MRHRGEQFKAAEEIEGQSGCSALRYFRLMRGQSHPVKSGEQRRPTGMLAVLGERVTYTFILDDEVASIHFDRRRGEIFFKGHNIRHLELTESQLGALDRMKKILSDDSKGVNLAEDYSATLERFLADNNSRGRVPDLKDTRNE